MLSERLLLWETDVSFLGGYTSGSKISASPDAALRVFFPFSSLCGPQNFVSEKKSAGRESVLCLSYFLWNVQIRRRVFQRGPGNVSLGSDPPSVFKCPPR